MQITITEGLAKLKNLDARINKEIQNAKFVSVFQVGKPIKGYSSIEDFNTKAKASLQSVLDLIDLRDRIKSEIVKANATNNVTIAGQKYSVAGAIERKNSITLKQNLINKLTSDINATYSEYEKSNNLVQQRLDTLLEQNFGKERKTSDNAVSVITDDFLSKNEVKISDPINANACAEKYSNEVNDFLTNVDVALSIANATTYIEI